MSVSTPRNAPLHLRAGEWVEVRSADEIMKTLDGTHSLEGMPFMPEMLQYCGKRFQVFKSAHKTCDTIDSYSIRRMADAVHLEGLRCDGGGHGGCQAGCYLFWKDAWLKRVSKQEAAAAQPARVVGAIPRAESKHAQQLLASARLPGDDAAAPIRYRCQATEVVRASSVIKWWDPRPYIRDLTSRNVSLIDFIRYGSKAVFNSLSFRFGGKRHPHLCGLAGQKTPTLARHLQPGEFVKVRSKQQILETLDSRLQNRGMRFDVEMLPFSENGTYKVLRRVETIINEKTGEMMRMQNPCIILDGVVCSGLRSSYRMFCPRAVYPWWREIWLERACDSDSGDARPAAHASGA